MKRAAIWITLAAFADPVSFAAEATASRHSLAAYFLSYRCPDMENEVGEGASRFVDDRTIQGPAFGVTWQL